MSSKDEVSWTLDCKRARNCHIALKIINKCELALTIVISVRSLAYAIVTTCAHNKQSSTKIAGCDCEVVIIKCPFSEIP